MKTKFNDSVRESVVEARRQGKTLQAISLATGVSMTTVKKWLTDAVARNVAGIRVRRYFSTDEQKMILAEYANTHSVIAI